MPTGPFGFPRVTSIGPFVNKDADQQFSRKITDKIYAESYDNFLADHYNINLDNAKTIRANLTVYTDDAANEVAFMRYWIHDQSGIAGIKGIAVDEDFRNMEIAKTLKQNELEYMKQRGIETVFTDVVTEGGYNLAKSVGFEPINELDIPIDKLRFNSELKQGIMFKEI